MRKTAESALFVILPLFLLAIYMSTVENNLYKLYIYEKYDKRAFNSIKNNNKNTRSKKMRAQSKFRENLTFFPKKGYCTNLGAPILINYTIFFNVRIRQIHWHRLICNLTTSKFRFCKGPFETSMAPMGSKKGGLPTWKNLRIFFAYSHRPSAHFP